VVVAAVVVVVGDDVAGPIQADPEVRCCIPDSSWLFDKNSGDKEDL
jgi:hypothetical protein